MIFCLMFLYYCNLVFNIKICKILKVCEICNLCVYIFIRFMFKMNLNNLVGALFIVFNKLYRMFYILGIVVIRVV